MQLYHASLFLNILRYYYEIFRNHSMSFYPSPSWGAIRKGSCKRIVIWWQVSSRTRGLVGSQGQLNITLEQLISYLQLWGRCFDRYFNFDTDFSDRGFANNIANQLLMERAALLSPGGPQLLRPGD